MGKPVDFRRSAEASYPERCLVKRGSSANEKGKRKKRKRKGKKGGVKQNLETHLLGEGVADAPVQGSYGG
jgi:hypothetical protein